MAVTISVEMSDKLSQQLADGWGLVPLAQQFREDQTFLAALLEDFIQHELALAFGVPRDLMRQTNQGPGAQFTYGMADRPYRALKVFPPAAPERDDSSISKTIEARWRYGVFPR
jgi:hypothetical protein